MTKRLVGFLPEETHHTIPAAYRTLTFAGGDQKVAAIGDVAEVQMDDGSRVSAARQRHLSEVRHIARAGWYRWISS